MTTNQQVIRLAQEVWNWPFDHDFEKIVAEGQFIDGTRATGGFLDSPECKIVFIDRFIDGYVTYFPF